MQSIIIFYFNSILSTCKLNNICVFTAIAILSSVNGEGNIKRKSYEKPFVKGFEVFFNIIQTLYLNNTPENVPKYGLIKYPPSNINIAICDSFIPSLYNYIRDRLYKIKYFYNEYKIKPYEEDRARLEKIINSENKNDKINLNDFNCDESMISDLLSTILIHLSHIADTQLFKNWINNEENIQLFYELYTRTTIPNQIYSIIFFYYSINMYSIWFI